MARARSVSTDDAQRDPGLIAAGSHDWRDS